MSEPAWLTDMDIACGRANYPTDLACAWAKWAIGKLPLKARKVAAKAWRRNKMPAEVLLELQAALARPGRGT